MFIVGELINGMYSQVAKAILNKDKAFIQDLAKKQVESGSAALDLNCGPGSKNPLEDMVWLVESVQDVTDKMLCIDSTKYEVIQKALEVAQNETMINSANAEDEKLAKLVALAQKHSSALIALTMDKKGIPQNKEQRLELAVKIVGFVQEAGFDMQKLFLDPVLMPINVAQAQLVEIIEAIKDFKVLTEPSPKTIVGLSNISQGAKTRSIINRTFVVMGLSSGLDAAILDPLDKQLIDAVKAAELVLNKNIYCDSFLGA